MEDIKNTKVEFLEMKSVMSEVENTIDGIRQCRFEEDYFLGRTD